MDVPGLDASGSGQEQVVSCYERGKGLSVSIKCREFLEQLKRC